LIKKEDLKKERNGLIVQKSQYNLYIHRIEARIEEIDKELKKK
jgi:hypothetical protein